MRGFELVTVGILLAGCRGGDEPATRPAGAAGRTPHVTIEVRTGDAPGDGADGHAVELCLAEGLCLPVDFDNADVLRPGRTDVLHLEGGASSPARFDRVELRSAGSADVWRPSCIAVAVDGEVVHCEDDLDVRLGDGEGASRSWRDPRGLHLACTSCAAESLTHGPLVGALTPEHARLWARTDHARDVVVFVHDEADPSAPVVVTGATTRAEDDFTAILDVSGLAAGHRYRATFEVDGALAATQATFHTPPEVGAPGRVRIAHGSCARVPPQSIFDVAARSEPDLFVFGGDNTYADSPRTDAHWAHLRAGLEHPPRAALVAHTSSIAIWDDHDFTGNDSDGTWKGKDDVLRAFEDYWPNASLGADGVPGVFSTVTWGRAQLFLLDVRSYRSPDDDRDGTMLGDAQERWLERELAASRATFKVLVSGSVWGPSAGETWLDHPAARARIFDRLAALNVGGVVLLGGDLHRSMLRRLPREGAYALPEIVSSPLAVPKTWRCPAPSREVDEIACYDGGNAVAILDIDTTLEDPRLDVRIVAESGATVASMSVLRSTLQ